MIDRQVDQQFAELGFYFKRENGNLTLKTNNQRTPEMLQEENKADAHNR